MEVQSSVPVACSSEITGDVDQQHRRFLQLLPAIQRAAQIAFRQLPPQAREEAVQDVVALAFAGYARLVERGLADRAYATPLAQFGIGQVRCGRGVGVQLHGGDVLARACQARHHYAVESLDRWDRDAGGWREVLVQDQRSTPAEIAAIRIDLSAWLARLPRRTRAIAQLLATGESTSAVARRFRVTAGRISQLRRELEALWHQFQGEPELAAA